MPVRWATLALAIVSLLAGCSAPGEREAFLHELPSNIPKLGVESGFRPDSHAVHLTFFNVSGEGWGEYHFFVGDGGTARACFFSQEALSGTLEFTYAPIMNKDYDLAEEFGCSRRVAEAEAGTALPAGAYAFALMTSECPRLDCSFTYDFDLEGADGEGGGSTHWTTAEALVGRGDGEWRSDPAYPPLASDGPAPTPEAVPEG